MHPTNYFASDFGFNSDLPLETLADKGLAHTHIRIVGTGSLARIPKQSQLNLDALSNLLYQKTCFERASPSGSTPRLLRVVDPNPILPRGALIVQEIIGRTVEVGRDLTALAKSLSAVHSLCCPVVAQRAPLKSPFDPLQEVLQEIEQHLAQAGFKTDQQDVLSDAINRSLAIIRRAIGYSNKPPIRLIGFDVHPGNFMVTDAGDAILVDLEKCRYSYAGFDLAHATNYTSTTWDKETSAMLSVPQVADFYSTWSESVNLESQPKSNASNDQQWFGVLRRAMWLWSISWCLKWQAVSANPTTLVTQAGEDWSESRSDPALIEHVRERVSHYLSPAAIAFVENEANELEKIWGNII
jgi:thiamine kinase-like enzyme